MCHTNGSLFYKKSLNMGPILYKNILKHGSNFLTEPKFSGLENHKICEIWAYFSKKIPLRKCCDNYKCNLHLHIFEGGAKMSRCVEIPFASHRCKPEGRLETLKILFVCNLNSCHEIGNRK